MLDTSRNISLASALSALAGYVDGIGFLHLGGLFVSFMSGNSTRMGVSLAEGQWLSAAEAFGLIALFVIGAAAGSLIVLGRGTNRQPWLLLAEASLLAAAALCYSFGLSNVAVAAIVLAMGLENAVFQINPRRRRSRPHLRHRRAGEGRATGRGGADRWRALGLGAEFTAMGGDGDGFPVRCARLLLDQSRRDLVCRRRSAGVRRDPGRDNPPIALTANAACPI